MRIPPHVLSAPTPCVPHPQAKSSVMRSPYLFPEPWRIPLSKKLYVGNLSYSVGKTDLEQMFAPYGAVNSAQVITDRDTGSSKGFGFVEMASDQEAQAAISALNGKDMGGRSLVVNEARPQEPRSGGGGFGGRGGSGHGGRGGFGGKRY